MAVLVIGIIALIASGAFVIFLFLKWPSHSNELKRMEMELELHYGKRNSY